jgi:hypothetical protein
LISIALPIKVLDTRYVNGSNCNKCLLQFSHNALKQLICALFVFTLINVCYCLFVCLILGSEQQSMPMWRLTGKSQRNFEVFDLDARSDIWLSFHIWSWAWQSCVPPLLQTIIHELLVTLFSQNLARHLLLMWKLSQMSERASKSNTSKFLWDFPVSLHMGMLCCSDPKIKHTNKQ